MSWAVTAIVAAAALTAYNQKEVARKQDRDVTAGIRQRMQSNDAASSAMQKALASLRDSSAQPAVAQAKASYLGALAQNPTLGGQPATVGATSDAYRTAAGVAGAASADKAAQTAGLMAATDAPGIQRQGEAVQIGKLGSVLNGLGIAANDQTNIAQMKARGEKPNPWIGLTAAALSAYGGGAAGAAGAAANSGSSSPVQQPSSTGYYQGGSFAGGGNYTGPQSTSTDWASNVKSLYGTQ